MSWWMPSKTKAKAYIRAEMAKRIRAEFIEQPTTETADELIDCEPVASVFADPARLAKGFEAIAAFKSKAKEKKDLTRTTGEMDPNWEPFTNPQEIV